MDLEQLIAFMTEHGRTPDEWAMMTVGPVLMGAIEQADADAAMAALIPDRKTRDAAVAKATALMGATDLAKMEAYVDRAFEMATRGVEPEPEVERLAVMATFDHSKVGAILAANVLEVASDVPEAVGRIQLALVAGEISGEVAQVACELVCPDETERRRYVAEAKAMFDRMPPTLFRTILQAFGDPE